jgi:hypothetical protein
VWLDPTQADTRRVAALAERRLIAAGCFAIALGDTEQAASAASVDLARRVHALVAAGVVVLVTAPERPEETRSTG